MNDASDNLANSGPGHQHQQEESDLVELGCVSEDTKGHPFGYYSDGGNGKYVY
jgi:hypothetical protein